MLFDTHAHLDDPQLLSQIDSVIQAAASAGLKGILAVATTAQSAARCVNLADRFEMVYAAVGIQPNHVGEVAKGDWDRIVELASHAKVRAIGETGLDYYWNDVPLEVQRPIFADHIRLSLATGLPLVIHMREPKKEVDGSPCGQDIIDQLRRVAEGATIKGIMHSFTGNAVIAEECLSLGLHISFAGMVTYKNAAQLRDVVKLIPPDRLLIETDSPYLSPEPVRSHRPNQPAQITHTAACISETRSMELDELCRITTENARRLFGLAS